MKAAITLLLLMVTVCCHAADSDGIAYSGGDGSDLDHAIIISGAADEMSGVHAEHVWLTKHYPGWKLSLQSSPQSKGHIYDKMDVAAADGVAHSVFFDITSFFGK